MRAWARFHPSEPHRPGLTGRMNWLRAGVLGADDGIISIAGLVVGVASATSARGPILTAGIAGLVAGAFSMAAGEYVSVHSQRDTQRAVLEQEKRELAETPDEELAELAALYEQKGLTPATARQVAVELTAHDALAAHAEAELGIDPYELTSPWQAALASAVSFIVGAWLPLIAIVVPPPSWRIPTTFAAVLAALALTGTISARVGDASVWRAVARVVAGGATAMIVTFLIGRFVGTTA
jgi:VIT1/CCC1 family predicted Fe2+/Mn2+ transporter